MQTFLTSTSTNHAFAVTAKQLDNKRLNKQALEAWQIMMTNLKLDPQGNHREPRGWVNHPAAKMWRGCEVVLGQYIEWMCAEWVDRGFKTTIGQKAADTLRTAIDRGVVSPGIVLPAWLVDAERFAVVASTHRVALLSKNYEWYSQFGWAEDTGVRPESYDYVWNES